MWTNNVNSLFERLLVDICISNRDKDRNGRISSIEKIKKYAISKFGKRFEFDKIRELGKKRMLGKELLKQEVTAFRHESDTRPNM